MCGRISLYTPPAKVQRLYAARTADRRGRPVAAGEDSTLTDTEPPSWNVAPSRQILAVLARHEAVDDGDDRRGGPLVRTLMPVRWGLVPFWAKDPSIGNRMANARAEQLEAKPAFKRAFERRRCLVPADGFYEWKAAPPGVGRGGGRRGSPARPTRLPWYFTRQDGAPLAFAGLWEVWRPHEGSDELLHTCTIITTDAGPDVASVHDRMPVVVEPGDWDEWLGIDQVDRAALRSLLSASPEGTLVSHPVDPRVNKPEIDDPDVIRPVEDRAERGRPGEEAPEQLEMPLPGADRSP